MAKGQGRKQDRTPNKIFTVVPTRNENGDIVMNVPYNNKNGDRVRQDFVIEMRGGRPTLRVVKENESEAVEA